MSRALVVVCEGRSDFTIATEIADRVLLREIDWLDDSLLDSQRQWLGRDPDERPLHWSHVGKYATKLGIRAHGHFDGAPGGPDAAAARKVIRYVKMRFDLVDAIVLVRDTDDQSERRAGLEQARTASEWAKSIIIGVANPEREAWVICGFDPGDDEEQSRLQVETQKLGGSPCLRSHELTACKDDQAPRSPKRVLRALCGGDWDRERRCWRDTQLTVLMERGRGNGLSDYIEEISSRLAPLFSR